MAKQQRGSVLIISMVLLIILTVTALSSMNLSTVDEKIASSYRDQQLAFQAAEAALSAVENMIRDNEFRFEDFRDDCTNGLCLTAWWPKIGTDTSTAKCSFDRNGYASFDAADLRPWEKDGIWTGAQTQVLDVDLGNNIKSKARYLVEWRCFTLRYPERWRNAVYRQENAKHYWNIKEWTPLYRITVLASGATDNSRVMLQSTYKNL